MTWLKDMFKAMPQPILVALISVLAVSLLRRLVRDGPAQEDGNRVVRFGSGLRVLSLFLLLAAGFVAYAAAHASPDQRWLAAYVALGFNLGALCLAYVAFGVVIIYDDDHLLYRSPLSGEQRFPWTEITGGGYSGLRGAHYLAFGERNVWISEMMDGSRDLMRFAERKWNERAGGIQEGPENET